MVTDDLLSELTDYCRRTGFKASTVCVRALGDSRFVERYRRRLVRTAQDAEKLRRYMADNPPDDGAEQKSSPMNDARSACETGARF